jgi:hypothetical protein
MSVRLPAKTPAGRWLSPAPSCSRRPAGATTERGLQGDVPGARERSDDIYLTPKDVR